MTVGKAVLGWRFINDADTNLRYGEPTLDPDTLRHIGPLVMGGLGLYAHRDSFDALMYASGPILCRVECSGDILESTDVLVCRERRVIARQDAREGLRYFARMQQVSVAHLWDYPQSVLDWLMTGDEVLRSDAKRHVYSAAQDDVCLAGKSAAQEAYRLYMWRGEPSDARCLWHRLVAEAFEGWL